MSDAGTIPILSRAIALLSAAAGSESGETVKHLSATLRIPSATCYRIVRTFVKHNWLRENERGKFGLAFGLAHLARSYADVEHRLGLAEPVLQQLAHETGLSAKITLREGAFAVTARRAEPPRLNAITSPVGATFPLAVGSAAAVLLAGMEDDAIGRILAATPVDAWQRQAPADVARRLNEVRAGGLCHERGQQHPSIFALSVPLGLGPDLPAALSVVGWPDDFEGAKPATHERRIRTAAARIHKLLGVRAPKLPAEPFTLPTP